MQTRLVSLCIAGAAGILSLPAQAGGFGGIAIGESSIDETVTESGVSAPLDDDDITWKVFGGYYILEEAGGIVDLGIEAGWADLGDHTESPAAMETEGLYAAGIASVPLSDTGFSVHGKAGLYFWDQDISTTAAGLRSHDDIDAMYGIGAKYVFGGMFGVQVDWERYEAMYDIDMVSLGLTVNF